MHNLDKWLWDNYGTFDFYQLSLLALLVSNPYPLSCFTVWKSFRKSISTLTSAVFSESFDFSLLDVLIRLSVGFFELTDESAGSRTFRLQKFSFWARFRLLFAANSFWGAGSLLRQLPLCFNTSSYFTGRLDRSLYFGEVQWTSDEPGLKFWHFWSFDTSSGLFGRLCD